MGVGPWSHGCGVRAHDGRLVGTGMRLARRVLAERLMKRTAIPLVLACLTLSGCFFPGGSRDDGGGVISFRVHRDIDEQLVEGSLLGGLLGSLLPGAFAIDLDLEEETRARSTGPAQHVYLTELTLAITPTAEPSGDSDDFDFLDSIEIFVESRQSDSALPRRRIAYLDPVPEGARTIALEVEGVDLIDYIEEGAQITASASGRTPTDDVSFDGRIELLVEVL